MVPQIQFSNIVEDILGNFSSLGPLHLQMSHTSVDLDGPFFLGSTGNSSIVPGAPNASKT